MRVHSTLEVNTNYSENPFIPHNAGTTSSGEPTSTMSFDDYLRTHIQQTGVSVANRTTESQIAGILCWGILPTLKVQPKPEQTPEDIAY